MSNSNGSNKLVGGAAINRLGRKMAAANQPDLILTHRIVEFFDRNPEPLFPRELVEEVMHVFWEKRPERDGRFSPSSLGLCHRRQACGYIGVPQALHSGFLAKTFLDGHMAHAKWQLLLKHLGLVEQYEFTLAHPYLPVSGAMDVLGKDDQGYFGVDIKTTSWPLSMAEGGVAACLAWWDAYFAGSNPPPPSGMGKTFVKYWRQVHGYMLLAQMQGYDVKRFSLLMDLKGQEVWREIPVPYDQRIADEVGDEWLQLDGHVQAEQLPQVLPECMVTPDMDCPHRHRCLGLRTWQDAVDASLNSSRLVRLRIPRPVKP